MYAITAWGSVEHPPISIESSVVPRGLMKKYPLVTVTAMDLVDRLKYSVYQDAPNEKPINKYS